MEEDWPLQAGRHRHTSLNRCMLGSDAWSKIEAEFTWHSKRVPYRSCTCQ